MRARSRRVAGRGRRVWRAVLAGARWALRASGRATERCAVRCSAGEGARGERVGGRRWWWARRLARLGAASECAAPPWEAHHRGACAVRLATTPAAAGAGTGTLTHVSTGGGGGQPTHGPCARLAPAARAEPAWPPPHPAAVAAATAWPPSDCRRCTAGESMAASTPCQWIQQPHPQRACDVPALCPRVLALPVGAPRVQLREQRCDPAPVLAPRWLTRPRAAAVAEAALAAL